MWRYLSFLLLRNHRCARCSVISRKMVVGKRAVGTLIRQTVYNMAKRRRLDNDIYQPPHVRHRLKVLDMVHKYKLDMTHSELLAYLFKSSA